MLLRSAESQLRHKKAHKSGFEEQHSKLQGGFTMIKKFPPLFPISIDVNILVDAIQTVSQS